MLKPAFQPLPVPRQPLSGNRPPGRGMGIRRCGTADVRRRFAAVRLRPGSERPGKIQRGFGERGIEILSLATSLSFDARFAGPPVIGRAIFDQDRTIREGRRAIDLASALGCPIVRRVRVSDSSAQSRRLAAARITDRLKQVLDQADRTGCGWLENGGSFGKVSEVVELLDACDSPLLGVCYSERGGDAGG